MKDGLTLRAVAGTLWLAGACVFAGPAEAEERGFSARQGLDLAVEAARAWDAESFLVYVENDASVGTAGRADRWGYLFFSPSRHRARSYSIREGEIVLASDLDFKIEAPPIPGGWIDSDAALRAADEEAGRSFREEHGGVLATTLLMRGAFHDENPDLTTWTVIYTAPDLPSLFVVVNAASGKVIRTWRG
jgi:hypothetical protein